MRLRPDDFWRLSVEEWRWLNEAGASAAPSRAEIEALAALYPDETSSPSPACGRGVRAAGLAPAHDAGARLCEMKSPSPASLPQAGEGRSDAQRRHPCPIE